MSPLHNPEPAVAAAGWTKRTGALESFYPRNTLSARATSVGAAYNWSAYTEISASLGSDFIPHVIHAGFRVTVVTYGLFGATLEIEIATGAADSEVLYARFHDAYAAFGWPEGAIVLLATGKTFPCGPDTIAAGSRLSFRVRCSLADTQVVGTVALYLGGYDTAAPAGYTVPNLDSYIAGDNAARLLTTPSGSHLSVTATAFPDYGSWVEIIATAGQDLLVWGALHQAPTGSHLNKYLEFGTGATDSETPRGRLAIPGQVQPGNTGIQLMRRPVFVASGERLAVRATGSTGAMNHQFLYEEV